jgi:hypothetical protein
MRNSSVPLGIVAFLFLPITPIQAGLYLPAMPTQGPDVSPQGVRPLPFSVFRRDVLEDLLRIANPQPPESKIRQLVLQAKDALLAKSRTGSLTLEDRVNLSGYLIRLRQYPDAIDLLTPVVTRESRNFMVFANLATAEQMGGHLERAISHLEQALDFWPSEWPGLTADQLRWYQKVEKYHLTLLRHRWVESRLQAKPEPVLDTLFFKDGQPVHYVGDHGKYEAGKIAPTERDKLPPDTLAIVQQLLIWLPDDVLLYWQLGEVLNAQGDVSSAATVFYDCVGKRRLDAPELRHHRQILGEVAQVKSEESATALEGIDNPPAPTSGPTWLPDRNKLWTAGSIFAIIVAILTYFQIREVRRRRAGRPS